MPSAEHNDIVGLLRHYQALLPLGPILATAGVVLLVTSSLWAVAWVWRVFPFLPPFCLGLVCLVAAAATCREGVLVHMPIEMQDVLLKRSCFDLLMDDARFHNFVRRAGRMLLLVYARSEGEVRSILTGLDQEYIDSWFRDTMIDYLPHSVRRILLPEHEDAGPAKRKRLAKSRWHNAGHAAQAISRMRPKQRHLAPPPFIKFGPEKLVATLQEKRVQISEKLVEPPIGALLRNQLVQSVYPGKQTIIQAVQAGSVVTASCWFGMYGLVGWLPAAQGAIVQGFRMVGGARIEQDLLLSRVSRTTMFLGIFSSVIFAVTAVYADRVAYIFEKRASRNATAAAVADGEGGSGASHNGAASSTGLFGPTSSHHEANGLAVSPPRRRPAEPH